MGASSTKKKISSANRRLRERSRLSFLFVIFFFCLFSLIFLCTLMTDGNKHVLKDENDLVVDGETEDYSNWDISYEEVPTSNALGSTSNVNSETHYSKTKLADRVSTERQNRNDNKHNNNQDGSEDSTVLHSRTLTNPAGNNISSRRIRKINPIQPDWQKVVGTKEQFYVYSAYHNSLFEHIRIIGATRTKSQQHVFCRFYDNDTRIYITVNATIKVIRENWNLKFSACFVICYIPDRKTLPPRYVSVISSSSVTASASNILRVQYGQDKTDSLVNFSVCVKPIHFSYDSVLPFLEWVEFHKLMGVTRFTFYNHTIGQSVGCAMREYGDDDVDFEVLPWSSLPFVSQKEIRTEGLFAALNDCVYRARGSSKYLVLVDLDEMIVPRKLYNYTSLLDKLDTLSNRKKIGAYSFQNAFFYLQWNDDQSLFKIEGNPLAERVSKKLLSLRKTRRRSRLHPHKQRSKYICDPEKVVEAGNHFVWEMATGYFTLSVPAHLGSLHHYRVCEFGGDQCTKNPFIVDKSSHNFGQQLAIRVADKLKTLASKCHFDIDNVIDSHQTQRGESTTTKNVSNKKPLGL